MEDQLVQVLRNSQSADKGLRTQAEADLKNASTNPAYPVSLASVAAHASVGTAERQLALSSLRLFIEKNWFPDTDDDEPQIPIADDVRQHLRQALLDLALGIEGDNKVKVAASYAIGKIAIYDFPESWPTLLPTVLGVIPSGTDAQLHGALKVLSDLVDEALTDEQFFSMARDISNSLTIVALDENRKPMLKALAVSVFSGCFNLMDSVKGAYAKEVKTFAEELLQQWNPLFLAVLKGRLPEAHLDGDMQPESWNSDIALKLQVVKTLLHIRRVFPNILLSQSTALFTAIWEDLSSMLDVYQQLYLNGDCQGRLENSDGLPYSLDFLVVDEIDFLNQCFRAAPVQAELDGQLKAQTYGQDVPWMMEIIKMLVAYGSVTWEMEGMWDLDCSLYIAEETSVTADYNARIASGDLLIKLGEWFDQKTVEALFAYTKSLFPGDDSSWRAQESALFLFVMLCNDFQDLNKSIPETIANSYLELIDFAINRPDQPLLRARGYLVAGSLGRVWTPPPALTDRIIQSITSEESEVAQVASIKAMEGLINAKKVTADRQVQIISAIESYIQGKDMTDMENTDELLVTLSEGLRAAIGLDSKIALSTEVQSIDLLFLIARLGASNFQVTMLIGEAFEEIVRNLSDPESYSVLCTRILPTLMGAFEVANLTDDNPLVVVATELLVILAENSTSPLPAGFVAAVFPKLTRLMMESVEGDLLRPGAQTVRHMLAHDHEQVFTYQDPNGRSGLEVCLHMVDRQLGPALEDSAACEVGGFAAELVEKAGQERLGPFLAQLLQAVANRLATAESAAFVQSLILVFARLSLNGAQDVVDFLNSTEIHGDNGLRVVISKWLENSVHFAGYDEVRLNIMALTKLFSLNSPLLQQIMVKGDLIVDHSDGLIKTRSRARKNPDTYTIISAPLKIIKLLIQESAAAITGENARASAAANFAATTANDDSDGEGWEDDDDSAFIDFSDKATRDDLMAYIDQGSRRADDETQAYLEDFFRTCASQGVANFHELFSQLDQSEREKLGTLQ